MPADLFGRSEVKLGGAMSADATRVTFANLSGTGLLLQNLDITYQQEITRLYALDKAEVYFVAGRTSGNMKIGQVIGPTAVQTAFYTTYGNVCASNGNLTLTAAAGCGTSQSGQLTLTVVSPFIESFGLNMTAQQMTVNVNLSMTFVALQLG